MNVWMKTVIVSWLGVSEARFLAHVTPEAAWHYVAQGWADYA